MSISRIYEPQPLAAGELIPLGERATHYLKHVLRVRAGEDIIIFNGEGGEWQAEIKAIEKRKIIIKLHQHQSIERESPLDIHLGQCMARFEKMDFIIQKAVELGVKTISPLLSERTQIQLSSARWEQKHHHFQQIIISACEQCGRNTLPILNKISSYTNWLKNIESESQIKLLVDPEGNASLRSLKLKNAVILAIGPEGGFSSDEKKQADQNRFLQIALGPRILRTETAGLAVIASLQSQQGDL